MTPQARRPPAWPVVLESSWPPGGYNYREQFLTATKIVLAFMDNNSAAHDRVDSEQGELAVLHLGNNISISRDGNVSEIASMAVLISGSSVLLSMRVPVATSGNTAVGVVAKGMDVEAVVSCRSRTKDLGTFLQAAQGSFDNDRCIFVLLGERDGALDDIRSLENADSSSRHYLDFRIAFGGRFGCSF